MMGQGKEILNTEFFSSINIYGENEDKALHMLGMQIEASYKYKQ